MFVTNGERPQVAPQAQLSNARQTRDQQKKAFLEILSEANEMQVFSRYNTWKDEQRLQHLAGELEEQAFVQSNGENTREYRTRVNTIKMRMKGLRGKVLRNCLFENTITAKELMAMDMNKLSEEFLLQYLKENQKQAAAPIIETSQSAGPPRPTNMPRMTPPPPMAAKVPVRPVQAPKVPQLTPQAPLQQNPQKTPNQQSQQPPQQAQEKQSSQTVQNQLPPSHQQPVNQQPPHQQPTPQHSTATTQLPAQQRPKLPPQQSTNQITPQPPPKFPQQVPQSQEPQQQYVPLEFPPQQHQNEYVSDNLQDLSIPSQPNPTQEIFQQMEKNLEGMKHLADLLDQDDEEYQEDEEQEYEEEEEQDEEHEEEQADVVPDYQDNQGYQAYVESVPLSSNNLLNQEFLQEDPQDVSQPPEEHLLDQEIVDQEQNYYEEEEPNEDQQPLDVGEHSPAHYEEEEVQDQEEVPPNTEPYSIREDAIPPEEVITPILNPNLNNQFGSYPNQDNQDQFTPEENQPYQQNQHQTPYLDNHAQRGPQHAHPTFGQQQQSPLLPFLEMTTSPIHFQNRNEQADQTNPVAQAVFDMLLQQRDEFYAQQIQEQHQINESLQQNIKEITVQYTQQIQTLMQRNHQLQQSHSQLKSENESVKAELQNARRQFQAQLGSLQQQLEQERQAWNEERVILMNVQPSQHIQEEFQFLASEQQQFTQQLAEVSQRGKEKLDLVLQQLKSRATETEKVTDTLNQMRMHLIKLHPNNQQQWQQPRPIETTRTQPQSTRNHQPPPPEQEKEQQQQPPQPTELPKETRTAHAPVFNETFQPEGNVFGDSGSTQTKKQFLQEDSGKPPGRNASEQPNQTETPEHQEEPQQVQEQPQQQVLPPPPVKSQPQVQQQQEQVFGHPKLMNKRKQDNHPVKTSQQRPNPFPGFRDEPNTHQETPTSQIQWDQQQGQDFFQETAQQEQHVPNRQQQSNQQPSNQQPIHQQPLHQQPTHQQPPHQQPPHQQPTQQQPTYQQPTHQQPTHQQPAHQQPSVGQPPAAAPAPAQLQQQVPTPVAPQRPKQAQVSQEVQTLSQSLQARPKKTSKRQQVPGALFD